MSEKKFGLTHWPKAQDILDKLDNLVNQPIKTLKKDKMKEYMNYFESNCQKSKEITDKAKKIIPGGVQHNLAFNYPFPICISKAEGAYM